MYLPESPVYFVKGNKRKAVYHTVVARELESFGWVEEGVTPDAANTAPVVNEVTAETGGESTDESESEAEPEPITLIQGFDLDSMTKVQLVQFAEEFNIEFKSNISKAELLNLCKQTVNG
jgi:hypothetical protein